jgi:hypothetical protein
MRASRSREKRARRALRFAEEHAIVAPCALPKIFFTRGGEKCVGDLR